MTLNHIIEASADKLTALWPGRRVHADKIPREADGAFFVGITESGQEKKLDRRGRRTVQMEILYFLRSDDNMEFHDWAEAMYDSFRKLNVADRTVKLTNRRARRNDDAMAYQFLFDVDFFFVEAEAHDPDAEMRNLIQREALK